MRYFRIRESIREKVAGCYPQIELAQYTVDPFEDKRFIDAFLFQRPPFEPIIAKGILVKRAKLTDFVSASCPGFTGKLLTSGKLKRALEPGRRSEGVDFFNAPVIYKGEEIADYWLTNPYVFNFEFIDFAKTEIYLLLGSNRKVGRIELNDPSHLQSYLTQKKSENERFNVRFERLHFKNVSEDFFTIRYVEGGVGYFVSEDLKETIENPGCSGVDFSPSELTLFEFDQTRDSIKPPGGSSRQLMVICSFSP